MIRTFGIASILLLASCATVEPPPRNASPFTAPTAGLSPQEVATGFGIAVIDGCAAAAEAGQKLEQFATDKIVRDSSASLRGAPKPGVSTWAPKVGQGIVSIEESQTRCEVAAYGPPVESTFNTVVAALRAKGYVSQPMPPPPAKSFEHALKASANGRTVSVTLVGNEPGAPGMMSRFSGLYAFVTVSTP
jgi:hypothetical protein